jgi:hypothetical protein
LDEKFNERYRFYDSTINPTIEKAFHAVAIDEIRKVFDVTLMRPHSTHIRQQKEQVVQVWFPGVMVVLVEVLRKNLGYLMELYCG